MKKETYKALSEQAKSKVQPETAATIDIMEDHPSASVPNPEAQQSETQPPAEDMASPPEAKPPAESMAPPPEARRQINYRPTITTAERLRLISFQQRRPVQELVDEAVLLWLANKR
jgi:type II secretory pathway component HofQ